MRKTHSIPLAEAARRLTKRYLVSALLACDHRRLERASGTRESGLQDVGERKGIISDIEVLRAAAVMFVLYQHRGFLLFWNPGQDGVLAFWGGVDLFFAVSGFVIARGLLKSWRASKSHAELVAAFVAFWIRRVWRIWPTSLFWIGVVCLLSPLWGGLAAGLPSIVAAATGAANIEQYVAGLSALHFPPLLHYWSLSLEEQFYLCLPLVLLLFRSRKSWLAPALLLCALIQFFLPRPMWSLGFALRSDALVLGVLIALAAERRHYRLLLEPVFFKNRPWLSVTAILFLLFLNAAFASGRVLPFSIGAVGLVSAVLVFIASFDRNYLLPPGRAKDVLVWVGSRSYALYIVHLPVYLTTRHIWSALAPAGATLDGTLTLRFILTALVLCVGLAELNFRFLETPLRRRGAALAKAYFETRTAALSSSVEPAAPSGTGVGHQAAQTNPRPLDQNIGQTRDRNQNEEGQDRAGDILNAAVVAQSKDALVQGLEIHDQREMNQIDGIAERSQKTGETIDQQA